MPCVTEPDYEAEAREQKKHNREFKLRAGIACATLTFLEKTNQLEALLTNGIDYEEAGFKEEDLRKWWKNHKAEDDRRRKKERRARLAEEAKKEKERRRKEAIESLTPAQREALGYTLLGG